MKHTEVALRRPVTTVVVFVALSLVGLLASRLLPLENGKGRLQAHELGLQT